MKLSLSTSPVSRTLEFLSTFLNMGASATIVRQAAGAAMLETKDGAKYEQPATIMKALVAGSTEAHLLGRSPAEQARAAHFLSLAGSLGAATPAEQLLDELEVALQSSSYVAGPLPTVADVVVLQALQEELAQRGFDGRTSTARWCTQVLAETAALSKAPADQLAPFLPRQQELQAAAPSVAELDAEVAALLAGVAAAPAAAAPAAAAAAAAAAAGAGGPKTDAELTEEAKALGLSKNAIKKLVKAGQTLQQIVDAERAKQGGAAAAAGGGAAAAAAEAAAEGPGIISKCDFRVGLIRRCWKHPEATKLFCEEIDLGEDKPRNIASGLVEHYPDASALEGRKVIVAANLKPRPLVGFKSHGMVLCASNEDKSKVVVLNVPEGAQVGERVTFAGHDGPAASAKQMDKGKVLIKAFPDMRIDDALQATWQGVPFMTTAGPVTIDEASLKGGNVA